MGGNSDSRVVWYLFLWLYGIFFKGHDDNLLKYRDISVNNPEKSVVKALFKMMCENWPQVMTLSKYLIQQGLHETLQ